MLRHCPMLTLRQAPLSMGILSATAVLCSVTCRPMACAMACALPAALPTPAYLQHSSLAKHCRHTKPTAQYATMPCASTGLPQDVFKVHNPYCCSFKHQACMLRRVTGTLVMQRVTVSTHLSQGANPYAVAGVCAKRHFMYICNDFLTQCCVFVVHVCSPESCRSTNILH